MAMNRSLLAGSFVTASLAALAAPGLALTPSTGAAEPHAARGSVASARVAPSVASPSLSNPIDEGQGTAEPGTRLDGLRPGNHVFGVPFDPVDMLGTIVVVEIGGS